MGCESNTESQGWPGMIVVDANVIIYLVRETAFTPLAREAYDKDPDWTAPEIWEAEVLNGLLMEVRAGSLELEDAILASSNAAAVIDRKCHRFDRSSVLRTAKDSGLTAYDACYVSLARSIGALLVTEDRQIKAKCPDVARSLKAFLDDGISSGISMIKEKKSPYRAMRK